MLDMKSEYQTSGWGREERSGEGYSRERIASAQGSGRAESGQD